MAQATGRSGFQRGRRFAGDPAGLVGRKAALTEDPGEGLGALDRLFDDRRHRRGPGVAVARHDVEHSDKSRVGHSGGPARSIDRSSCGGGVAREGQHDDTAPGGCPAPPSAPTAGAAGSGGTRHTDRRSGCPDRSGARPLPPSPRGHPAVRPAVSAVWPHPTVRSAARRVPRAAPREWDRPGPSHGCRRPDAVAVAPHGRRLR